MNTNDRITPGRLRNALTDVRSIFAFVWRTPLNDVDDDEDDDDYDGNDNDGDDDGYDADGNDDDDDDVIGEMWRWW